MLIPIDQVLQAYVTASKTIGENGGKSEKGELGRGVAECATLHLYKDFATLPPLRILLTITILLYTVHNDLQRSHHGRHERRGHF